jgi:hypothetical protein
VPAKTAKQKRFMNMVKARKSGHDVGGPRVEKAAGSMTMQEVNDFVGAPVTPARGTAGMRKKLEGR